MKLECWKCVNLFLTEQTQSSMWCMFPIIWFIIKTRFGDLKDGRTFNSNKILLSYSFDPDEKCTDCIYCMKCHIGSTKPIWVELWREGCWLAAAMRVTMLHNLNNTGLHFIFQNLLRLVFVFATLTLDQVWSAAWLLFRIWASLSR